MASPFKFFRKYSGGMMIVMVILSMLLFTLTDLFSDPGKNLWLLGLLVGGAVFAIAGAGSGRWVQWGLGGAVLGAVLALILPEFMRQDGVVSTSLGVVTQDEVQDLMIRRRVANEFLYRVGEKALGEGMGRRAVQFGYGQQPGDDAVFGKLLRAEADELGLAVNASMVGDFLKQMTAEQLTAEGYIECRDAIAYNGRALSENQLQEILQDELKAHMAFQMLRPVTTAWPPGPEVYWEYFKRLNVRQQVVTAALDVDDFVDEVEDPTDAEVEDLFSRFRKKLPNRPEPGMPGFYIQRRAQLAYLELDSNAVEKEVEEVTDADIQKYYDENKETPMIRTPVIPDAPVFDDDDDEKKADKADEADKKETEDKNPEEAKADEPPAADPKVDDKKPAAKKSAESDAGEKPMKEQKESADKKADDSKQDSDKKEEPKKPEAKEETPKKEAPRETEPKKESPKNDESAKDDAPKPEPKEETPKEDAPAKADSKSAESEATDDQPDGEPEESDDDADDSCSAFFDEETDETDGSDESDDAAESSEAEADKPEAKMPDDAKPADTDPKAADEPATIDTTPTSPTLTIPEAPAMPAESSAEVPETKYEYRELDDELKKEIREELTRQRVTEKTEAKLSEAKAKMESLSSRRATKRLAVMEESPKKFSYDNPNQQEALKELREEMQTFDDELDAELKKYAADSGFAYVSTPLMTYAELTESEQYRIGSATEPVDNPMMSAQSPTAAYSVFSALSDEEQNNAVQMYYVRAAQRSAISQDGSVVNYLYWPTDWSEAHIPELDEPGVRETVVKEFKRLKARELAKTRGEELVTKVEAGLKAEGDDRKDMETVLKDVSVTGKDGGGSIAVRKSAPFSWLRSSTASPMDFRQRRASMSPITFDDTIGGRLEKVGQEFMEVVFDEMNDEDVEVIPNGDLSKFYVVHVTNRFPTPEIGEDTLRERFAKEGQQFAFGQSPFLPAMTDELIMAGASPEWQKSLWKKYGVNPDAEPEIEE